MAERCTDDKGDIRMARHKFAEPAYFEEGEMKLLVRRKRPLSA